jgi:hypothetical protein
MSESGFVVVCNDPSLRTEFLRHLSSTFPAPPEAVEIHVSSGDPALPDDAELIFEQPATRYYACGDGRLTVEWVGRLAVAVLDSTTRASVTLSHQAVERFDAPMSAFFDAVLMMMLRRVGWHHVHAATLEDPLGRGWLIAGNSGGGKSTTAALLAGRGWRLGGDDGALLAREAEGVVARPIRKKIALRPASAALLDFAGEKFHEARGKSEAAVAELTGAFVSRSVPRVVAFTTVAGEHTTVAPMTGAEVLAEFVRWSAWVALERELAQDHLDLLAELGRQAECYRVTLAKDLFENPELLMEATT